MSLLNCKYCGLLHDTDSDCEHEEECESNPTNMLSFDKTTREQRLGKLSKWVLILEIVEICLAMILVSLLAVLFLAMF